MKKKYLGLFTGLTLVLLVGCQSISPVNSFSLGGQSDQMIKTSVLTAFMNNTELATVPVRVEIQKGTVFLSGYVKTIRQSDIAAEIASKVPGVHFVQNGLIVRK